MVKRIFGRTNVGGLVRVVRRKGKDERGGEGFMDWEDGEVVLSPPPLPLGKQALV